MIVNHHTWHSTPPPSLFVGPHSPLSSFYLRREEAGEYMISSSQVYQVARAVANGEGDWAEVPHCVREAIVISLSASKEPNGQQCSSGGPSSTWPKASTSPQPQALPPVLSEGAVQHSIQTFEDGAWMRDQAVRTYAQFHNSVETLQIAMKGQLRSIWRTALQLHPSVLGRVRRRLRADVTDDIPNGVEIAPRDLRRIRHQEMILEELVADLQTLRDNSVRFAAHWLTDEEKVAMGANPAYLRPEDVDRALLSRDRRAASHTTTPSRRASVQSEDPISTNRCLSPTLHDPELARLRRAYTMRLAELSGSSGRPHQCRPSQSRSRRGTRRSSIHSSSYGSESSDGRY